MLLHTATGHVQKLNDYKESEWQANGLLWECKEALRGNLCGCAHCLLGDIYNIITSLAHHWLVFTLFWGGESVEVTKDKLSRQSEKGAFLVFKLYLTERINLFSVRWCWWFQRQSLLDYSRLLYLLCREQQLYWIARTNTCTHRYAQMYSMYTHTSMQKNILHRDLLW